MDRKYKGSVHSRLGRKNSPTYITNENGKIQMKVILSETVNDLPEHLINFLNSELEKKDQKACNFSDVRLDGDKTVFLSVAHFGEAQKLTKLSGIKMGKIKLHVSILQRKHHKNKPDSSTTAVTIQKVKDFCSLRYDPMSKILNLNAIDKELAPTGFQVFNDASGKSKSGAVLLKIISEAFPEVECITLEENQISSLSTLVSLPQRIPNIISLSLKNNNIKNFKDLEKLPGKSLKRLKQLKLDGNPIKENFFRNKMKLSKSGLRNPGDEEEAKLNFYNFAKKIFPTILSLDDYVYPIEQNVVFGTKFDILNVEKAFFDLPATQEVALNFMTKLQLLDFYDEFSTFSLSINSVKPKGASYKGFDNLDGWKDADRSHTKENSKESRISNLIRVGPKNILENFLSLPNTIHDVSVVNDKTSKIFVESFKINENTILITVHGEFLDLKIKNLKRSFDRTFLLRGNAACHDAFKILSDTLCLRVHNKNPEFLKFSTQKSQTTQNPVPIFNFAVEHVPNLVVDNLPSLPPQLGSDLQNLIKYQMGFNLNNEQHLKVLQFSNLSGLNYAFSYQCLMESAWNYEIGLQNFQNVKASIPPNAFQFDPTA
ncbi:nuclear mRNA export, poly(A)+RNA binding protein [Clydaea vesicula]|uniref:Nuclear mRNA export, poly(A)+RNA binding protein n=1 Tax=Clydaea vesicula TaxID=447962 RepID=A0AAD5XW54_9FUNG|nr:nuclear mRNA export, poly(A)+RNA binding protein [Clydaea vesicula]